MQASQSCFTRARVESVSPLCFPVRNMSTPSCDAQAANKSFVSTASPPASLASHPRMGSQSPPRAGQAREYPLMTRDEIEVLIARGLKIVILNQHVLKVDAWLPYHPGGDKALLHMVGKDATDEIQALHSQEAQQRMMRYRIGRISGTWTNFTPPIQGGQFRAFIDVDDATCGGESGAGQATESSPRPSSSRSRSRSREISGSDGPPPRRRKHGQERAASPGAVSSSSSSQSSAGPGTSAMAYIDAITREKISLDAEKYPAVDAATQQEIAAKYRALHRRIADEGLYECSRTAYVYECCRYVGLFSLMLLLLRCGHYTLSAVCMGLTWHQLVFLAHDAGHMGVTHNYQVDTVIGIVVADFVGGLSLGWWKRSHNVHHIVTNAPEHDPDIEHMPLFAVSHRLLGSLRSSYYDRVMEYDAVAKVMLRIQPWTYYPLLALGRFNLYRLSWDYLAARRGPRRGPGAWHWYLELAGHVFFWAWFGYGLVYRALPSNGARLAFVLVSHVVSSPLHVQIVLSHFAMSTADLGPQESFAQRMLRTTMDVDCPPWLDFVHGGLQFQAVHHLFPRVPRHNLRRAQGLVVDFCRDAGIPYALCGFADGNSAVVGRLSEVARQAAILAECQRSLAG